MGIEKILPNTFEMDMYRLHVRLVNEGDAEYIVKLRTNPKVQRFIHDTSSDVLKQVEWIKQYKERESKGEEYYFIYQRDGRNMGLNRLYEIDYQTGTFNAGSWLCEEGADVADVVSTVLIYNTIAFEKLGLQLGVGHDGVHVDNKKVIKFNQMVGMTFTGKRYDEDKGYFYTMELNADNFYKHRDKLESLLGLKK